MNQARRPVPDPDDASAPFWEACARHELILQRCASCKTFRHPPRPACPACTSFDSEWVPASGRARVWSWVIAHPPVLPAFADRAPYNVVVVELAEGVRMIGNMVEVSNHEIVEGLDVTVAWDDVEDDASLPAWRRA